MDEMVQLALRTKCITGLVTFSSDTSTVPKFTSEVSSVVDVTASLIHGSSRGSASYIVNAADLCSRYTDNAVIKFADATYLIIPAANSHMRDQRAYKPPRPIGSLCVTMKSPR